MKRTSEIGGTTDVFSSVPIYIQYMHDIQNKRNEQKKEQKKYLKT